MLTMIGKRLMFAIPSLIGVVIVTFLLTRALPGDPAAYFAGPAATKEAVDQIRKKLGFDKPLIEGAVTAAATGDSATYDKDVKGFVDLAFTDIPRIPLYQPFVNVAMQKNISGYQYWFHRRLDYRSLVKA